MKPVFCATRVVNTPRRRLSRQYTRYVGNTDLNSDVLLPRTLIGGGLDFLVQACTNSPCPGATNSRACGEDATGSILNEGKDFLMIELNDCDCFFFLFFLLLEK